MRPTPIGDTPAHDRYDVVIVGGAIIGTATAWFLSHHLGFDGRVLVVERDMSLEQSSTCLLYTSPSPRDLSTSRMPSSA